MDDTDPDTVMIVAGLLFSLLTLFELYSSWKRARNSRPP